MEYPKESMEAMWDERTMNPTKNQENLNINSNKKAVYGKQDINSGSNSNLKKHHLDGRYPRRN